MLVFTCSSCGAKLQMGEELAGKQVRCSSCQAVVTAPLVDEQAAIQAAPSSPAPVPFEKSDAKGVPPRERDDRDDIRRGPRRDVGSSAGAAVGAGLGIGAIVMIVLGLGACLMVPCGIALLVPAVQKVREAAARTQSANNMKQIALGIHNYESTYKRLPSPKMLNPQNNQGVNLSWRVSILPYIEQNALYNQFDPNSAWNSPRNSAASNMAIMVYQDPMLPPGAMNSTPYQYFTGPGTLWPDNGPRGFAQIKDGLSNTFMFGQSATGVPWAEGKDMVIQPGQPLPLPKDRCNIAFADATVRFIDRTRISDATLSQYLNPDSGQARPQLD
jgi:hypothetical protein